MKLLGAIVFLIAITSNLQLCSANKSNKSVIIIALPRDDDENVTSWEKSAEILPGAYVAVESINNDSSVLTNVNLELVIAESGLIFSEDEKYSGNVLGISADLAWQNKDVIGIAGLLHPNTLLALQAFQLPLVSLIGFSNSQLPENGVISLTASTSVLTDSLSAFLAIIDQTRIGVISESTHSYYSTVSNDLLTKANVSMYIHVSNSHHKSFSAIVDEVANFKIHVIFLSVRPSIALSVLLEACKRSIKWPNYAWILHSYRLEDLRELAHVFPAGGMCNASNILEGIFMFQLTQERRDFNSNAKSSQTANPVAFLLHDAIWALALAAQNKDTNISLKDSICQCSDIYIYQASNLSAELVGVYSGKSNAFTNVTVGTLVYDGPILQSVELSPYLMVLSGSCLLFNTLLLILYICFRNHPDVKSTNVSLSLLIFIGCYILIGFTIVEYIKYSLAVNVCLGSLWLSALGLSSPLVLATVLVKMLRVYHIFTLRRRVKPNMCTNYIAPIIYTLIILSPCAMVLTLWTIIDPLSLVITYVEHPGFVAVNHACFQGTYSILWYGLIISYQVSLSFALVFIAIKTRKLRLARFKDTKKVNVFIYFSLFAGYSCFAYWQTLYVIDPRGPSRAYVLIIGHIILVLIAQFTLFVPKIWPPLIEKSTGLLKTSTSRIKTIFSHGSSANSMRV